MELSQKILFQFQFCGLIYSMRKKFWDHRNGTLTKNSVSVPILWPNFSSSFLIDTELYFIFFHIRRIEIDSQAWRFWHLDKSILHGK